MIESPCMRVLIATDGIFPYSIGGMQRYSKLLIDELAFNYPSILLTVLHPHFGVKIFDMHPNIEEIDISQPVNSGNYLLQCYEYSKTVAAIIDKGEYDIIYAQGLTVWNQVGKFTQKLIVNPHGLESYQAIGLKAKLVGFLFRSVQSYLFRNALFVASEGGHLTGILEKIIPKERIFFIPNATNCSYPYRDKERPEKFSPIKLLFVARFAENKGIHILLETIRQIVCEYGNDKFEFHLAGTGPLFKFYSESFIFPNVRFWGKVSDDHLHALYEMADIFVLPTLYEGMPTVILEAMAHSLPVIASDVGGIPELVDAKNGYLIERNNVAALKKSIVDYYRLSSLEKNIMARHSYEKVSNNFTWKKVAADHVRLFNAVIKNGALKEHVLECK